MSFVLVALALFTALIAAEVYAEPVDSLSVKAEPVDSYFLNDRAITRIPTKVGLGALTAVGTGFISAIMISPYFEEDSPGSTFTGEPFYFIYGLLVGYPVGGVLGRSGGEFLLDDMRGVWSGILGGFSLRRRRLARGGAILGITNNRLGVIPATPQAVSQPQPIQVAIWKVSSA